MVLMPSTAPSRPAPVSRSPLTVPSRPLRLSTRAPWPAARRRSTTRRPSTPVPPVTRISVRSTSRPPFPVRDRHRGHGPELLGVDHEANGPDAPLCGLECHDAVGTSIFEVADKSGPSVDSCPPDDESWRGLAEYP